MAHAWGLPEQTAQSILRSRASSPVWETQGYGMDIVKIPTLWWYIVIIRDLYSIVLGLGVVDGWQVLVGAPFRKHMVIEPQGGSESKHPETIPMLKQIVSSHSKENKDDNKFRCPFNGQKTFTYQSHWTQIQQINSPGTMPPTEEYAGFRPPCPKRLISGVFPSPFWNLQPTCASPPWLRGSLHKSSQGPKGLWKGHSWNPNPRKVNQNRI